MDNGGIRSDAGWKDDPKRPGIQRYWVHGNWDDSIAPRAKPEPAWKVARMVALGILIAVAVIFTVWRVSQPSASECEGQRYKVRLGVQESVDSACLGR